jgi:hypothetical protein
MKIVGIDPGFNGGIALFEDGKCLECMVMPLYEMENGKNTIDCKFISKYLLNNQVKTVIIEQVHTMPGQGIASSGNFMKNFGKILGTCEALEREVIEISPQKWKKLVLRDEYAHDMKQGAIDFCLKHFPHIDLMASKRCKKPHDGKSDAMCIAVSYYVLKDINNTKGI